MGKTITHITNHYKYGPLNTYDMIKIYVCIMI